MVKQSRRLNVIFASLSDPIRRDILQRVSTSKTEMSVGEIASSYDVSLAAVSKHLKILEKAELIIKERFGKEQRVHLSPEAFKDASAYLRHYEKLWNARLDSLERYLSTFSK